MAKPEPKGSRLWVTDAERERIAVRWVAAYQKGASIRDIARKANRSYGMVHRVLADAGIEFRSRGGARKK